MTRFKARSLTATVLALAAFTASAGTPPELRVGMAGHAFDHLGNLGAQAEAAAASGATIIYATGLGGAGYLGLPARGELRQQRVVAADYVRDAKRRGIRLALGYVCATSMVKLETFDRNWPAELRAQFRTPPSAWRQQDSRGNPLPSWYGGDYQPACMNNPDWRAYERFIVRQQLETGHDGIFFDNPTVHPQGCYCPHCMARFAAFLRSEGVVLPKFDFVQTSKSSLLAESALVELRKLASGRGKDFMRFRCTIAADFFADMRQFARSLNRRALVTANNSLNSADALFAQCQSHAYNIHEMSRTEDFVVVEDMSSQPRTLPDGRVIEYGPTYRQLHAISRGKPVVAVTIADGDYTTPPNLVRLAMAEAAANGASHLWWPTWPEAERARMVASVAPQARFLRENSKLLNNAQPRRDAVLFLPFRRWVETNRCAASQLAAALTAANVQYEVICEDQFASGRRLPESLKPAKVFVVESPSVLNPAEELALAQFRRGGRVIAADGEGWLDDVKAAVGQPSVVIGGPPTLRASVFDQSRRTIVHLLNLNVQRRSSFKDSVTSAAAAHVAVRVPFAQPRAVRALTADAGATAGVLEFSRGPACGGSLVEFVLPRLEIATLLVIER